VGGLPTKDGASSTLLPQQPAGRRTVCQDLEVRLAPLPGEGTSIYCRVGRGVMGCSETEGE
jgi:hypothetical protein